MLKKYLTQYKPFLIFLLKFFLSYAILTFLYQIYLNKYDTTQFEVDAITKIVARQAQQTTTFFGYHSEIADNLEQSSVKFFVKEKYVARVVEGCNAISVIILFIAFVIAFKGKIKQTFFFVFLGSILIYVLNIIRIALISIALYKFPAYEHLIHGVIFPLIIYGVVFVLWIVWVNKFSIYATKAN